MLIVGAKGQAKEVLQICVENNQSSDLCFFDNVSADIGDTLYHQFRILRSFEEAEYLFQHVDNTFTIGVGNPTLRSKLMKQFDELGGEFVSVISRNSQIGSYDVLIEKGANIFRGAVIANSVKIGLGAIVNYHAAICHDCTIGDFVEISPNATVLGRVCIGDFVHVGASATILPDVRIGNYVTIGAGAVVTKDVPDHTVVVGVPAKKIFYGEC